MTNEQLRKIWQKHTGVRLRQARFQAQLSMQQVANTLKYAKQLVHKWETGSSQVSGWDIGRLAALYQVSEKWLLIGDSDPRREESPSTVPMLSTKFQLFTIGATLAAGLTNDPKAFIAIVAAGEKCVVQELTFSEQAFAFPSFDPNLEPHIMVGDTVIVDGAVEPDAGDVVLLATCSKNDVVMGKWGPGTKARKTPPFELRTFNPHVPSYTISAKDRPFHIATTIRVIRDRVKTSVPHGLSTAS